MSVHHPPKDPDISEVAQFSDWQQCSDLTLLHFVPNTTWLSVSQALQNTLL